MPHPGKNVQTNKKLQLALLMLLFLLPPLAAYVLFYADLHPTGGGNYGDLITPAKPLQNATLKTLDGRTFQLSELRKKWALLFLGGRDCDEYCEQNLYTINQVRLAQGKNIGRVNSVFIVPDNVSRADIGNVAQTYPNILIFLAEAETFAVLLEQLGEYSDATLPERGYVYIVDPLGNLMMSYQTGADPSGMRKDLKRLLKLSQIG